MLMKTLEPAARPLARWRDILTALDRHSVTSAVVAWLYAVTGPLAILLAVSTKSGFGQDQVAAWIFGARGSPRRSERARLASPPSPNTSHEPTVPRVIDGDYR